MADSDFELDPGLIYLNHAAVSPWPRRTADAVKRFADENTRLGSSHYPRWVRTEQTLREQLQRLVNARSTDEIALLKNTSERQCRHQQPGIPLQPDRLGVAGQIRRRDPGSRYHSHRLPGGRGHRPHQRPHPTGVGEFGAIWHGSETRPGEDRRRLP
jgi:hypothetical protein